MSDNRAQIVAELEAGAAIALEPAFVARKPIRMSWWRRLWSWIGSRRAYTETVGMGRLSRKQHREMVRFARDSGNAGLLAQLQPKR